MKRNLFILLMMACAVNTLFAQTTGKLTTSILDGRNIDYKVGFLGNPGSWNKFEMITSVPWTEETVGQLKKLGFNTIQINLAWGTRPNDEALNLEDVVHLSPVQNMQFPQVVELRSRPGNEAYEKRRAELRNRIELCHKAGLRTIFHFGAPYNAHAKYGDNPPNCIMDPKVTQRYELLLKTFVHDFPGVDDILVYTYDQDAWLCSEFGSCPRCAGVPLPLRIVPFLNSLTACWHNLSPKGRLWWEPWELSGGQVLTSVENINPQGFGLSLHCNIAEVIATLPVDRWLKNTVTIARQRNIPAIVEYWLASPSEELETFAHFPYPLVTLRGLKAIANVPGVIGIKEYYGLNPTVEDPNLRMTSIFFKHPTISESEALQLLAKPYGKAAKDMMDVWRLTSEGMEMFPWEISWNIRRFGSRPPIHGLEAAALYGMIAHTPSWASSRKAIYMKTDNSKSDPWLIEDIQMRYQVAAERFGAALIIGNKCKGLVPGPLTRDNEKTLADIAGMRRRTLASAYHLKETNLATDMRNAMTLKRDTKSMAEELHRLMKTDLENYHEEMAVAKNLPDWKEMEQAIALLDKDVPLFLKKYFTGG